MRPTRGSLATDLLMNENEMEFEKCVSKKISESIKQDPVQDKSKGLHMKNMTNLSNKAWEGGRHVIQNIRVRDVIRYYYTRSSHLFRMTFAILVKLKDEGVSRIRIKNNTYRL